MQINSTLNAGHQARLLCGLQWLRDTVAPKVATYLRDAIDWLTLCWQVRRERRVLRSVSDETLADIGISRAQANAEHQRGFFDIQPRENQAAVGRYSDKFSVARPAAREDTRA